MADEDEWAVAATADALEAEDDGDFGAWDEDDDWDAEEKPELTWDEEEAPKPKPKKKPKPKPAEPAEDEPEVLDAETQRRLEQHRQKVQNFQAINDLFGGADWGKTPIREMKCRTEADYFKLAESVADLVNQYHTSKHFPALIRAVVKGCSATLAYDDVVQVDSKLSVLVSERQKLEKEGKTGKTVLYKKKTDWMDDVDNRGVAGGCSEDMDFM